MKLGKRAIKHVVVFALLGVVMSYAVAWGCAWDEIWPSQGDEFLDGQMIYGVITERRFDVAISQSMFSTVITVEDARSETFKKPEVPAPSWLPHPASGAPLGTSHGHWMAPNTVGKGPGSWLWTYWFGQGWPARCVRGASIFVQGKGREDFDIRRGSTWEWGTSSAAYVKCFAPIWTGLVINTAFYGSILWLLWFTPGLLRRGSRRRRGLCVRCGYDLRGLGAGSACPECGGSP